MRCLSHDKSAVCGYVEKGLHLGKVTQQYGKRKQSLGQKWVYPRGDLSTIKKKGLMQNAKAIKTE